eukprot:m.37317 g.37317  ORF g.37317 m.37317 type:complete len:60 (+) comp13062_c0_seq1:2615-2794(+)
MLPSLIAPSHSSGGPGVAMAVPSIATAHTNIPLWYEARERGGAGIRCHPINQALELLLR